MVAAAPGSATQTGRSSPQFEAMANSEAWKDIARRKKWQDTFLAGADFKPISTARSTETTAILKDLGIAQ